MYSSKGNSFSFRILLPFCKCFYLLFSCINLLHGNCLLTGFNFSMKNLLPKITLFSILLCHLFDMLLLCICSISWCCFVVSLLHCSSVPLFFCSTVPWYSVCSSSIRFICQGSGVLAMSGCSVNVPVFSQSFIILLVFCVLAS